jgi:hypothetical protein
MVRERDFTQLRSWVPIPERGLRIYLGRWILLDANRYAVTGALLTVTFLSILAIGVIWPFEMRNLLTETQAVQTVLNTFLSGIILLVSIVASVNSIVLSYDITSLTSQEDRIQAIHDFRRDLDEITDAEDNPTDPIAFLQAMAESIRERATALETGFEGTDREIVRDVEEYVKTVTDTAETLERSLDRSSGSEFRVLWLGYEADYGRLMNESRRLASRYESTGTDTSTDRFEDLIQALELFAVGREYFKTLYYSHEISELSRTLLIVSLPSILITASTILAINAHLLPDVWILGLPPLVTFVALAFTIALAPFIVLTAYMLRVATVARRTAGSGPFTLRS